MIIIIICFVVVIDMRPLSSSLKPTPKVGIFSAHSFGDTMNNQSYLIEPLLERAVASSSLPALGFIDRAAEVLVDSFDIGAAEQSRVLRKLQQDHGGLRRCKWIDEQLKAFFAEHPEGTAVELGAGLSTRFHRLSYEEDWPKFSWLAVDTREASCSISQCFPSVDNFCYLECERDALNWLEPLSQKGAGPYIIIVENNDFLDDLVAFSQLCQCIHNKLGHVHLIADLSPNELSAVHGLIFDTVELKSSMHSRSDVALTQLLKQLVSKRHKRDTFRRQICHFSIGDESSKEENEHAL